MRFESIIGIPLYLENHASTRFHPYRHSPTDFGLGGWQFKNKHSFFQVKINIIINNYFYVMRCGADW